MKKNIFLHLSYLLISATMLLVGCFGTETPKAEKILAYYKDKIITSNTLYIDSSEDLNWSDFVFKLSYTDNSEKEILLKTDASEGYEIVKALPETIEPGKNYLCEIKYQSFESVKINIIVSKLNNQILINENLDKDYDGSPVEISQITTLNGDIPTIDWYTSNNIKLESAPINAGSYYAKIYLDATDTYNAISITRNFTISKIDNQLEMVSDLDKTYNGLPFELPQITTLSGDIPTISWYTNNHTKLNTAPTNAGSYYVKLSIKASINYKDLSITKNFTITKAMQQDVTLEPITLNGTYSPSKTLKNYTLPSNYSWVDSTIIPTCDKSVYKAVYNPDSQNYLDKEVNIYISLQKAATEYKSFIMNAFDNQATYSHDITLPEGLSFKDESFKLSYGTENHVKVIYTPQDTINYAQDTDVTISVIYYKVLNKPTITSSTTYNGTPISVTFSGFDSTYMEFTNITGIPCNQMTINAPGTYYYAIKLKNPMEEFYCWEPFDTTMHSLIMLTYIVS